MPMIVILDHYCTLIRRNPWKAKLTIITTHLRKFWTHILLYKPSKIRSIFTYHGLNQIRAKIQVCRHKERTWNNNPTEYNFQAFYYQRRYVANIIKASQRCHFVDLITENKNDFKKIFSIANTLLHRETARPLPPTNDYQKLANNFNMFFINKIKKLWKEYSPQIT